MNNEEKTKSMTWEEPFKRLEVTKGVIGVVPSLDNEEAIILFESGKAVILHRHILQGKGEDAISYVKRFTKNIIERQKGEG